MLLRDASTEKIAKIFENKICEDCEMLEICNRRLAKTPMLVSETIKLFIESQSEKIRLKWDYFNLQPEWFKYFWQLLKAEMPDILKERENLRGNNNG